MPIYFDNAATSPLRKEVIESINEVLVETYGNNSSYHSFGRKAKNWRNRKEKEEEQLLRSETEWRKVSDWTVGGIQEIEVERLMTESEHLDQVRSRQENQEAGF